jgi:hypothetical protein
MEGRSLDGNVCPFGWHTGGADSRPWVSGDRGDRQDLCLRDEPSLVLGLRFYVCDGCDTVHASPDEPPGCRDCGGRRLREITRQLQADTYFLPPQ